MMILLTFVVSVACVIDKNYGQEIQGSLLLKPYDETALSNLEVTDTDDNGRLSRSEIDAVFHKYDGNDDGITTRHEYTEYVCKYSPELYDLSHYLFDEYDSNGDNRLDSGDISVLFNTIDTSGNEKIGQREFKRYWETMLPKYEVIGPHEEKYCNGSSACH